MAKSWQVFLFAGRRTLAGEPAQRTLESLELVARYGGEQATVPGTQSPARDQAKHILADLILWCWQGGLGRLGSGSCVLMSLGLSSAQPRS